MRAGLGRSLVAAAFVAALGGAGSAGAGRTVACVPVPSLSAAATRTLAVDERGIEQQVIAQRGGTNWRWKDLVSGRLREVFRGPRGKIHEEDVAIGRRYVFVDYDAGTWITSDTPSDFPYDSLPSPAAKTSRMYRDLIASRQVRVLGRTTLHGVPVIHVRQLETIPPPSPRELRQEAEQFRQQELKRLPKGFQIPKGFFRIPTPKGGFKAEHIKVDAWLVPSTYLPVRVLTLTDGRFTTDETDTWLRRTVRNLANTHVVIPAGFRRQHTDDSNGGGFFSFTFTVTHKTKPLPCHAL